DHTRASTGDLGQIAAKNGEMYSTEDGKAFVMKLYDGEQYNERRAQGKNRSSLPFVRTKFSSYTKVFDLSEFNLGVTSTNLFKTNRSMLATWQLQKGVDSIDTDIRIRKQTISNHLVSYLPLIKRDTVVYKEEFKPSFDDDEYDGPYRDKDSLSRRNRVVKSVQEATDTSKTVALPQESKEKEYVVGADASQAAKDLYASVGKSSSNGDRELLARKERNRKAANLRKALANPLVRGAQPWSGVESLLDSLEETVQTRVYNRARSAVRSITSQAESTMRILPGIRESRVKHMYDMHMKYSMALVCIIFIFIGAPMGAIVRKGGFGIPILVSIIFFVSFIILTIFCRKLAESFVVNGSFAGWLPCIILFP
ncbi:MAG: LptF/LptG family permease, partial [Bacteroidota bacterium]